MRRLLVALAVLAANAQGSVIHPTLINGEEIDPNSRPDIVLIRTGNAGCTASVIGPRVVLTASHCGTNRAKSVFSANGKQYEGTFLRSPLYPSKDHDIALIVVTKDVDLGGKPYTTVGGSPQVGDKLTIFGYGCVKPQGGGGNDGKLRRGDATITGHAGYDLVSTNGAALCYGDSGGPDYAVDPKDGVSKQVSVNSKGDIAKTNYTARLDVQDSVTFLQDVANANKIDICGITKDCAAAVPPPPPSPPAQGSYVIEGRALKITVEDKGLLPAEYVKGLATNLVRFLDSTLSLQHPIVQFGRPEPEETQDRPNVIRTLPRDLRQE
jgi:hypothetical protein